MANAQKFICVKGPVYIRKEPDDYSQVCSIIRVGAVFEVTEHIGGMIYRPAPESPYWSEDIWLKVAKGYVRRVNMLNTKTYMQRYSEASEYPQATSTLDSGDVVMMRCDTTDVYGRILGEEAYEPNLQTVYITDSSRTLALLGYPKGIQAWVPIKNLNLVKKYQKYPGVYYSEETLGK